MCVQVSANAAATYMTFLVALVSWWVVAEAQAAVAQRPASAS